MYTHHRPALLTLCDADGTETLLLGFIVYLVVLKRSGARRKGGTELSPKEVEELVNEWQPAPLVPAITPEDKEMIDETPVIQEFIGSNKVRSPATCTRKDRFAGRGETRVKEPPPSFTLHHALLPPPPRLCPRSPLGPVPCRLGLTSQGPASRGRQGQAESCEF